MIHLLLYSSRVYCAVRLYVFFSPSLPGPVAQTAAFTGGKLHAYYGDVFSCFAMSDWPCAHCVYAGTLSEHENGSRRDSIGPTRREGHAGGRDAPGGISAGGHAGAWHACCLYGCHDSLGTGLRPGIQCIIYCVHPNPFGHNARGTRTGVAGNLARVRERELNISPRFV